MWEWVLVPKIHFLTTVRKPQKKTLFNSGKKTQKKKRNVFFKIIDFERLKKREIECIQKNIHKIKNIQILKYYYFYFYLFYLIYFECFYFKILKI